MNAQGRFCDEHPNGQCLCPDKPTRIVMTNDTKTQVRVIEGQAKTWEEPLGITRATFCQGISEVRAGLQHVPATLIIGDTGVPKKQVIEMLRNIIMENQVFISRRGDVNATEIDDIKAIAAKFGFHDL